MCAVEQVESIAEVDPGEWNALAGGRVLRSHGWLRMLEETCVTPGRHRYFLLRAGSQLAAAAACRFLRSGEDADNLELFLLGRFRGVGRCAGLSILPALACGSGVGFDSHVLARPGLSDDESGRAFDELLSAVEASDRAEARATAFRAVEAGPLRRALQRRGYLFTHELPQCRLDVRWRSFDEYRRWLKRRHHATARNVSLEVNRGRRAGIVIEPLDDVAEASPRLHELTDAHYRRLNGRPFPFRREFFERLKAYLGDRSTVYAARKDGREIGVAVMLHDGVRGYMPMIGVASDWVRKDSLYFNLGYNRPIRGAIEAGLRALYLGKLLYRMKLRRGPTLVWRRLYVLVHNPARRGVLRALLAFHRRRIRQIAGLPGGEIQEDVRDELS